MHPNPKTRSEARSSGSRTYNTGAPCVNGHLSPRYTGSGTCVQCLHESNDGTRRRPVTIHAPLDCSPSDLTHLRLWVHHQDYRLVESTIWGLVAMRYPQMPHTWYRRPPKRDQGNRYLWLCAREDYDALLAFGNELWHDRCRPAVDAARQVTQARLAAARPGADPLPDWQP